MTVYRSAAVALLFLSLGVLPAGCDNPSGPQAMPSAVLPAQVTGTIGTCPTCAAEPKSWAVATATATIANPAAVERRVATRLVTRPPA